MEANQKNGLRPEWTEKVLDLYRDGIAHAFLLHFNVSDYVTPGIRLREYLGKTLAAKEIIVFYNIADGLSFARPSDEKRFRDFMGNGTPPNSTVNRALAQARTGGASDLPSAPAQVFPIFDRLLKTPPSEDFGGAVVVVEDAEMIAPDADLSTITPGERETLVRLEKWGRDMKIAAAGNMIFLVSSDLAQVHSNIRRASARWESVEIPLPGRVDRLRFITWYMDSDNWNPVEFEEGFDSVRLANNTAGLSYMNIEDILLRSLRGGMVWADYVRERKAALISQEYSQILEVWEPTERFDDIGGLDQVKDFFRRSIVRPLVEGNPNRIPNGVLMMGPAGTGKSIMARALANEAGVNAVLFRVGRILGKYVGESEGQLERALRAIQSMAPVVVFIDELDQQIGRGSTGDSDVSNRIFARLLEIMSDGDLRGSIIWLAATNRPDLIDAAMKRPGRFDQKVAFLIPDARERLEIFCVMGAKYLGKVPDIKAGVIAETEGWTGAEIEAAVVKAYQLIEDAGTADPEEALLEAVKRLKPSTADIQFMTDLAISEINDLDLLPPKYRTQLENRGALEKRIAEQVQSRSARAPREI